MPTAQRATRPATRTCSTTRTTSRSRIRDPGPVFAGVMVDAFSLAGNGPAHLSNGFRARVHDGHRLVCHLPAAELSRRSDRFRNWRRGVRSAVGRRVRTSERAPAMGHDGRMRLAVGLIAGLLAAAGCVLAPAMANGPPGRSLDDSLRAAAAGTGLHRPDRVDADRAPRPPARSDDSRRPAGCCGSTRSPA